MAAVARKQSQSTIDKKAARSTASHAEKMAAEEQRAFASARAVGYEPSGDVEWVPVAAMFVDLTTPTKNGLPYGREPERRYVMKMALDFDPDALGVVYLSYRAHGPYAGKYAILDGGHRVELMRAVGWGDQALPAFVYRDLTIEQEAALFVRMNRDRRAPTPVVIFRSQVAAGEPESVAIFRLIQGLGITFGHSQGPRTIQAVGTLQTVYRNVGAPGTRKALTALRDAWPTQTMALNGTLMEGAAFLLYAVPTLKVEDLAAKLADKLPSEVLSRARLVREIDGDHTAYSATAKAMLDAYNDRRRSGRVPMFEKRTWPKRLPYEGVGDVRIGTGRLRRR